MGSARRRGCLWTAGGRRVVQSAISGASTVNAFNRELTEKRTWEFQRFLLCGMYVQEQILNTFLVLFLLLVWDYFFFVLLQNKNWNFSNEIYQIGVKFGFN